MQARVAVIYYSATGNVHGLAGAVAEGAEQAGAEVQAAARRGVRLGADDLSEPVLGPAPLTGRRRSRGHASTISSGLTVSRSAARPDSEMLLPS